MNNKTDLHKGFAGLAKDTLTVFSVPISHLESTVSLTVKTVVKDFRRINQYFDCYTKYNEQLKKEKFIKNKTETIRDIKSKSSKYRSFLKVGVSTISHELEVDMLMKNSKSFKSYESKNVSPYILAVNAAAIAIKNYIYIHQFNSRAINEKDSILKKVQSFKREHLNISDYETIFKNA